jgi:E3 ubiquitin-protein ligase UBR7
MGVTPCSVRKVSRQPGNARNVYNHNFSGRFCECDQVYDVDAEEGTMFQCLVCEDWYHEKCIGEGRVPDQDDFDGFVCKGCVGKNEWLGRYVAVKSTFLSTLDTYPEVKVDIETVESAEAPVLTTEPTESVSVPSTSEAKETVPTSLTSGIKRSLSTEPEITDPSSKRVKLDSTDPSTEPCKWASLPPNPPVPFALFLKETFRDHLCRCTTCEYTRLRTLPMISQEEETYEPDEDNSDTGCPKHSKTNNRLVIGCRHTRVIVFAANASS